MKEMDFGVKIIFFLLNFGVNIQSLSFCILAWKFKVYPFEFWHEKFKLSFFEFWHEISKFHFLNFGVKIQSLSFWILAWKIQSLSFWSLVSKIQIGKSIEKRNRYFSVKIQNNFFYLFEKRNFGGKNQAKIIFGVNKVFHTWIMKMKAKAIRETYKSFFMVEMWVTVYHEIWLPIYTFLHQWWKRVRTTAEPALYERKKAAAGEIWFQFLKVSTIERWIHFLNFRSKNRKNKKNLTEL